MSLGPSPLAFDYRLVRVVTRLYTHKLSSRGLVASHNSKDPSACEKLFGRRPALDLPASALPGRHGKACAACPSLLPAFGFPTDQASDARIWLVEGTSVALHPKALVRTRV